MADPYQYVPPDVLAAQRRSAVFDALLNRNLEPQQVRTPLQGLAGLGSTLVSALMSRRASDDLSQAYQGAQQHRNQALQGALGYGQQPDALAGSDGSTSPVTAAIAGRRSVDPRIAGLLADPSTADLGEKALEAELSRAPQRGFFDAKSGKFLDAQGNITHQYEPDAATADPLKGIRQVGRQIVQISPDGTVKPIYTAPQDASSDAGVFQPLPPDAIAKLGLPPGTVAQRNSRTGAISVINKGVSESADPLNTKSLPGQLMNFITAINDKVRRGELVTPRERDSYALAKQQLLQPQNTLGPQGLVTTTPTFDIPDLPPADGQSAPIAGASPAPSAGASPAPQLAPPAVATGPAPSGNIYDQAAAAAGGTPMQPPPETSSQITPHVKITPLPGMTGGTPAQLQIAGYRDRMQEADKVIGETTPAGTSYKEQAISQIPVVGNYLKSPDRQRQEQARRDFVNAVLRRESGAAISTGEFENADQQYFPQPGDSEAQIRQKAANRATVINSIKREAGRVPEVVGAPAPGAPARVTNDADYNALPSGTTFIGPDGKARVKP